MTPAMIVMGVILVISPAGEIVKAFKKEYKSMTACQTELEMMDRMSWFDRNLAPHFPNHQFRAHCEKPSQRT